MTGDDEIEDTETPDELPFASDLAYLEAELAWVAVRCERLGLERRRDATPGDRERRRGGFFVDEERIEPHVLAERIAELDVRERSMRACLDGLLALQRHLGWELGIDRLVRVHALDDFERTVLILAAGPCVSRRYGRLYAQLEGERQDTLTVDLAFSFVGLSSAERVARRRTLGPRGRLVTSDLVDMHFGARPSPKELLSTEIELRGRTFSLLLGDESLGDELADLARLETPRASFDRVVLPEESRRRILSVIDGQERVRETRAKWGLDDAITYGRGTILLFDGPPGTGKTLCAHAIAAQRGQRILNVDVTSVLAQQDGGTLLPAIFREARVHDALLFFDECEALLSSRRLGNPLMHVFLTELERFEGTCVLATNLPELLDDALWRRALVRVHFDRPDRTARLAIWGKLLPPKLPLATDVELERLAGIELTGGEIKNAILTAAASAVHASEALGGELVTHGMLEAAAQEQGAGRRLTHADVERSAREEGGLLAAQRRTGFA